MGNSDLYEPCLESQTNIPRDIKASSKKNSLTENKKPIDDKFVFNINETIQDAKLLAKSSFASSLTYLCNVTTSLICFGFLGQYGNASELAGASFAYTWANVLCLGILLSIDQGFAILAARLFGAEKHRELGVLFQKNVCVLTGVAIPLLMPLLFADYILIAVGLDEAISNNAGVFLKALFPSIVGLYFWNTTRSFLISQNIFNVQCVIAVIAVPFHTLLCYLFVDVLEMSIVGVGIAKSITDVSSAVSLLLYIKYSDICHKSWIPFTKECIEGWWPYLKHTLILGGNLYVEWISLEISIFIITLMGHEKTLGAHGVALNFIVGMYAIPLGNNMSMQIYMGNAVGEGSRVKAQKYMAAGLFLNMIISGTTSLMLVTCSDMIAGAFVSDEETKYILSTMLFVYGFGYLIDTYSNHLGGAMRILGREHEVVTYFFYLYVVLEIILQVTFGLLLNFGYVAVWISTAVAAALMLILMLKKFSVLNWDEEIQKLKLKQKEDEQAEYIEMVEK